MTIYVYSDESGVFDKAHNNIFVFGGIVLLSKEDRDIQARKYSKVEKIIQNIENLSEGVEAKASILSNKSKSKIFRSLNDVEKFGIVVHQKELSDEIFKKKEDKQRYLDWAYKYALKRKLEDMIKRKLIVPETVTTILIYTDEHATKSSGIYDLKKTIEQELIHGMHYDNSPFYRSPLFKNANEVKVTFCNSASNTLIRAADIIANRLYYLAVSDKLKDVELKNFNVVHHPPIYN